MEIIEITAECGIILAVVSAALYFVVKKSVRNALTEWRENGK